MVLVEVPPAPTVTEWAPVAKLTLLPVNMPPAPPPPPAYPGPPAPPPATTKYSTVNAELAVKVLEPTEVKEWTR